MILQLNPPLPLHTLKGDAVAHFLIDYGLEHDLMWVCFMDESGECWTFNNREVQAMMNITYGATRMSGDMFKHK